MYLLVLIAGFAFLVDVVQELGLCDDDTLYLVCAMATIFIVLIVAVSGQLASKAPPRRDFNYRVPDSDATLRGTRESRRAAWEGQRAASESLRDADAGRRSAIFESFADPDDAVEAEVARELGLRPSMSKSEINGARRRYAVFNHPDKFPLEQRPKAEQRMQIANSLADLEIRRVFSP